MLFRYISLLLCNSSLVSWPQWCNQA